MPPERGLTLLLPPPDASPGDSRFICRSGLSTRPPFFPHPLSRYFLSSWRLSGFPPLPLRDPPPPPSEGIISPLLCWIIPPVRCPCPSLRVYAPPQPRLSGIISSPFLSLWGDSSSLDLCPGLSLPIFYPRKSTLPFRLPLTGERGENVVVIGWAGVSSSAVISSVVVRVLQASGCTWRRGTTRDGCAELVPEFSLWRCAPYAGKYLHPSCDVTSDGDEGEPTWISAL